MLIEISTFSFKKMYLKRSSAKWRPFCFCLNVFTKSLKCAHVDPGMPHHYGRSLDHKYIYKRRVRVGKLRVTVRNFISFYVYIIIVWDRAKISHVCECYVVPLFWTDNRCMQHITNIYVNMHGIYY